MPAHPERFALDLEVPPILDCARPQVAPRCDLAFTIGPSGSPDTFARGVQLTNERFEGVADPLERGGALFVQLSQQLLVPFAWRSPDHELHCRRRTPPRDCSR